MGDSLEETIAKRGLQQLVEDNASFDSRFLHGEVRRVTVENIKAQLILTQARLTSAEYVISSEPLVIAQYLAEIKHYELAVDLCIAFKQSPSYPITLKLKEYH